MFISSDCDGLYYVKSHYDSYLTLLELSETEKKSETTWKPSALLRPFYLLKANLVQRNILRSAGFSLYFTAGLQSALCSLRFTLTANYTRDNASSVKQGITGDANK